MHTEDSEVTTLQHGRLDSVVVVPTVTLVNEIVRRRVSPEVAAPVLDKGKGVALPDNDSGSEQVPLVSAS
ncbi:hypothetical protein ACOSP7_022482 [Xanthoceras sorbifolium]